MAQIRCMPVVNRRGQVFAVAQILNKRHGEAFDAADEQQFAAFSSRLGIVLESWWEMARVSRAASAAPREASGGTTAD